ncbi:MULTISPECIES: ATP synthase subunit I [Bacillales]|uniref:ATP synthase subunit I n=1 Tax=Lysinibacillus louembei TaxID=1470088 RepID=A0ABZ0RZT9_9BACI|nr:MULTISPECIES: ATP synthase subunit I [Bacillales]MCT6923426.1 ATP synthase subunit I [Metasolibacillus sp.]MCT6939852.1 ATP synthase subunit I [Metasolibacillus sp.]WPK12516.1 ATP synthase subunit I [Lysinibacillus louembei]
MEDLHYIFAKQKKVLFFLLALCVLGWAFTPYASIFAGLGLGAFFGTYNFWILVRRMDNFDRSISEGRKASSIGTALRFGSGVAAVAIAMSLPEKFHLVSTVIGLMIPYIFLVVERIVHLVKHH